MKSQMDASCENSYPPLSFQFQEIEQPARLLLQRPEVLRPHAHEQLACVAQLLEFWIGEGESHPLHDQGDVPFDDRSGQNFFRGPRQDAVEIAFGVTELTVRLLEQGLEQPVHEPRNGLRRGPQRRRRPAGRTAGTRPDRDRTVPLFSDRELPGRFQEPQLRRRDPARRQPYPRPPRSVGSGHSP